jgi:anti-sigma B factor antagonist
MLKVNIKKLGAVKVLSLEGQIINGDTETLRSTVQALSGASDIILELSNVTIVDAHGLGVLLQLREQALARGARFELMNVSHSLNRILEITRLNTVFDIKPRVEFFPARARAERALVAA